MSFLCPLMDKIKTKDNIEKMTREGGTRSGNFWKTGKRLMRNDKNYDDQAKDENNKTIKGESKIKEHIANYYENLYQAREQREGTIDWTETINTKIKQLRKQTKKCTIKPFTMKELNNVIKKLEKQKATGPEKIPNTALIEANQKTRRIYLKIFNEITKNKQIPEQLNEGEIIRVYKGNGIKGKCSNERGITISSNMGKTDERLYSTTESYRK